MTHYKGPVVYRTHHETRHLVRPQALAALALESDVRVTEDVRDELVHRRLLEPAVLSSTRAEFARALDFLSQEIRDVCQECKRRAEYASEKDVPKLAKANTSASLTNTAIFATQHSSRYTRTRHLLTRVLGRGLFVANLMTSRAIIEAAEE